VNIFRGAEMLQMVLLEHGLDVHIYGVLGLWDMVF